MNGFSELRDPLTKFLVFVLVCFLLVPFFLVMFSEGIEEFISCLLGITDKDEISKKYEILKFLGIGMGGLLLALQALASHKRAKAMEDGVLRAEQGQRQERLKNAIEHLGGQSVSVRLGGAYELVHLAQDTEYLRKTVLDILCAHIRQTTGEKEYQKRYKSKPSEEIQSLLTLLFVREHQVFKGCRANLQESWLNGACLNGARLTGAVLAKAHMQGTALVEANMQGADLCEASLQGASLFKARLQGANLADARMQLTVLSSARLQGSRLSGAYLHEASLSRTQLQGAGSAGFDPRKPFAENIRALIGQETDLFHVFFKGELTQEEVDSIIENLPEHNTEILRSTLNPHINRPRSEELPQNCGADLGTYTKEEAEKWIAEYE